MFCIVDIETTGGRAKSHQIIEIGACLHNGHEVVDTYHTYINPGQHIPAFITQLTGITDDKVVDAPFFADIAQEFMDFLEGHVFVAHNVGFDFSFIKAHFDRAGLVYNSRRICTVRLSRKILPGYASYSLGKLCGHLGIEIIGRHTALGDAEATAKVFDILLRNDTGGFIDKAVKKNSGEGLLPPYLPKTTYDALPDKQGVYYFLNKQSIPIYIGKSKHIKKRIAAHFGIGSETRSKNRFIDDIYDIKIELLEDDLITDLLECHEIKTHWPKHNKEYKKRKLTFGIYHYKDALGLHRFHISKVVQGSKPLLYFSDFTSAYEYVKELTFQFSLCPKHSGLQKKDESCLISEDESCLEACRQSLDVEDYKSRLTKAYEHIRMSKETFILLGKPDQYGNRYFVLTEEGQYLGFGQTKDEISLDKFEVLKKLIEPRKSSYDIEQIILLYLRRLDSERILV